MEKMNLVNELVETLIPTPSRECALPGCNVMFKPKVDWQKCCCHEHGVKLRWLRRKARIKKALERLNA
jgi:hypothetical protein